MNHLINRLIILLAAFESFLGINDAMPANLAISPAPKSSFVLKVSGLPNQTFQIRATPDFINWTNLGSVTLNAAGLMNFTDVTAGAFPRRFYQMVGFNSGGDYINNGLIAYWKLADDGGNTASDTSGNGNTLSLFGSPAWGSDYLALNGSTQYGDAGTNGAELVAQDMTVSAWIYKTGSSYKAIVDKSYNLAGIGYGGWGFRIQADGHILFWGGQECVDIGTQTVKPGEWTFVTVVWHSGSYEADFYINGILNSINHNGSTVTMPTYGYADLQLGNMENNAANGIDAFDGSLRKVGIYNRALSADEVVTNFLATEPNTSVLMPDLLYLKMTEGALNETNAPVRLADSSTTGHTNVILNVPYSIQWEANQASRPKSALHFNGSATYIDVHDTNSFNFTTNSFTINLWLLPFTPNGYVLGNSSYLSGGWFMSVSSSYQVNFGAETPSAENVLTTGDHESNWPSSYYNMVTVTRNGTNTPLIYINGNLVATVGSFVSPAPSTNSLLLGVSSTGSNWLDGNIGQPQIWHTNLSSSDVANLYIHQLAGIPWP